MREENLDREKERAIVCVWGRVWGHVCMYVCMYICCHRYMCVSMPVSVVSHTQRALLNNICSSTICMSCVGLHDCVYLCFCAYLGVCVHLSEFVCDVFYVCAHAH